MYWYIVCCIIDDVSIARDIKELVCVLLYSASVCGEMWQRRCSGEVNTGCMRARGFSTREGVGK